MVDDVSLNQKSIVLPLNTTADVGDIICLKEKDRFYQGFVLSKVLIPGIGYTIYLDTPVDYYFSVNSFVSVGSHNLAVDGSVTPVIFKISPKGASGDVEWDVTRLLVNIVDDSSMDATKFGGIPILTNGVVLRSVNGITKNIFNIKSNSDWAERAFDISYDDRASPLGEYSFRVRRSFAGQDKNGVTIRLRASSDDELQLIIYDDLSDLTDFEVVIQGHVVEN